MKFLASGKVKEIYELDTERILFRFSDRVSAYDVKFRELIPRKGEVLCKFAEYWFKNLRVANHFIERRSDNEIIVRRMRMFPIECIVRGYFYGSLASRWKQGRVHVPDGSDTRLAAKLPRPIFDPTTKSEHDVPVNRHKAVMMNLVTGEEFDLLEERSIEIYEAMAKKTLDAGFILADLKLEFGKIDGEDGVFLGDSIGPDECRLWIHDDHEVGEIQEAYDKQILRDWLSDEGYQKKFEEDRAAGRDPTSPPIPDGIMHRMTERYVTAYEKITGSPL